jgi:hypothetical protein
MKRFTYALLFTVMVMGMPMLAAAMSHDDHSAQGKAMADDMKHGDMDMHKGHDMASMDGDFAEIGKNTQNGVVATVKVKTYDEKTLATMKKMGMDATHHVMVFFTDEKTGAEIASGKVALKIKGQDAKPVMLMQMGTGFGGDVALKPGMYTFEIGTKLEDGNQRQFEVMFHNM